jgi:hypothetical protein
MIAERKQAIATFVFEYPSELRAHSDVSITITNKLGLYNKRISYYH